MSSKQNSKKAFTDSRYNWEVAKDISLHSQSKPNKNPQLFNPFSENKKLNQILNVQPLDENKENKTQLFHNTEDKNPFLAQNNSNNHRNSVIKIKLYKSQISNTNSTIKRNEKNIEELKTQEKKISQNIKTKEKQKEDIKKKCAELEQKIEEIKSLNEKLEKEKMEKENMSNSNITFSSLSRKEGNEEIIKELENKIIELDNEKVERDAYFQNFYDEMINMMAIFEQKTQKIMKMQNSEHPQKKLEINTENEILDSNLRNKSKNKINNGGLGTSSIHAKKGNENNNREIFINYTDNFRNKI